jgi:hypothetical protein
MSAPARRGVIRSRSSFVAAGKPHCPSGRDERFASAPGRLRRRQRSAAERADAARSPILYVGVGDRIEERFSSAQMLTC